MNRRDFLKDYVLELDKEFEFEGKEATWAPSTSGNPLYWGQEQSSIDLAEHVHEKGFVPDSGMALSPDGLLLAVFIHEAILVYSTNSKELMAKLTASERTISQQHFLPSPSKAGADGEYVLLGSAQHQGLGPDDDEYSILVRWDLDKDGKPLEKNGDSNGQTLAHGKLVGYDSKFLNYDATKFYSLVHNETTQQDKRPPDLLPQIVIYTWPSQENGGKAKEICRLKYHEDMILWASWSPAKETADTVVSASWDGTYRIWDAQTGVCRHLIWIPPPNENSWAVQNWSGSFSPDGNYVMLSGTGNYAVYKIEDGSKVVDLAERDGIKLDSWVRNLAWCPESSPPKAIIAIANKRQLLLWQPLNKEDGKDQLDVALQIKESKKPLDLFQGIPAVKWLDGTGQLLAVVDSAGNQFVWHRGKAWKWRFQRPTKHVDPEVLDLMSFDILYDERAVVFYTLDLDKKVRVWKY